MGIIFFDEKTQARKEVIDAREYYITMAEFVKCKVRIFPILSAKS